MLKKISNLAIVAITITATPYAAQAGSASSSTKASFSVIEKCSVTAKDVSLGTFKVDHTWEDVAATLGKYVHGGTYTAGSRGKEYVDFGSVTCESGHTYALKIKGSGVTGGLAVLDISGKTATLAPYAKKLDGVDLPDTSGRLPGVGSQLHDLGFRGVGDGEEQKVFGSIFVSFGSDGSTAAPTDKLATAGSYSDTLKYTLEF